MSPSRCTSVSWATSASSAPSTPGVHGHLSCSLIENQSPVGTLSLTAPAAPAEFGINLGLAVVVLFALAGPGMAEYTKAVVDGRPQFHISLVVDVSPNCDCHGENDVPILPNLGMFASFDALALDQACVDACLAAAPMPGSQLAKNLA